MRIRRLFPVIFALSFAACGSDPGIEPEVTDGGTGDAAIPAGEDAAPKPVVELEIGTGETAFEAFEQGAIVPLIMGAQGGGGMGAHFWVSIRARGIDPHGVSIHERITRAEDGLQVSDLERREDLEMSGDEAIFAGFRAVVEVGCPELMNRELDLGVEIEDAAGKRGSATRRFRGPAGCPLGCSEECDGNGPR